MEWIITIALIVIVLGMIAAMMQGKKEEEPTKNDHQELNYKAKKPLTERETEFHQILITALPDHHIFPQVALSRFIVPATRHKYLWNKINQKSVDWLICEKDFSIITAIELDDSTHTKAKDAEKDAIFKAAEIPLQRWKKSVMPSAEAIKKMVLKTASTT